MAVITTGAVAFAIATAPAYGPIAVAEPEPTLIEPAVVPAPGPRPHVPGTRSHRRPGDRCPGHEEPPAGTSEATPAGGVGCRRPPTTVDTAGDTVLGDSTTVRKAVSFADKVADSRDTTAIAQKLDEANVALRPGEWAVVHGLIVILAGLLATLLPGLQHPDHPRWPSLPASSFRGSTSAVAPRSAGRSSTRCFPIRCRCWLAACLPATRCRRHWTTWPRRLGGRWGRRSTEPSSRVDWGCPIEESLEAVAQRMDSQDFHWTVMAIRINRQVGGNLAEVLTNVAKTVRERERLRRQVKALTAEGSCPHGSSRCSPSSWLSSWSLSGPSTSASVHPAGRMGDHGRGRDPVPHRGPLDAQAREHGGVTCRHGHWPGLALLFLGVTVVIIMAGTS